VEIVLTPDQEAFVRRAIASGRLRDPEEAVQEALALWEERERRRMEILAAVDRAEASLQEGRGYALDADSMRTLSDQIKRRGRISRTQDQ
jgi:putative addiction module CopG family antidote